MYSLFTQTNGDAQIKDMVGLRWDVICIKMFLPNSRCPYQKWTKIASVLSEAVLTAIFVPILLIQKQELNIGYTNQYLWGGITAICAAYKTQSVYWTISIGTAVFIIGSALF